MTEDEGSELGLDPAEILDVELTNQQIDRITRYLGLDPVLAGLQALALGYQWIPLPDIQLPPETT